MENGRKIIKISLGKFLIGIAALVIIVFLGTNLYLRSIGRPSIFSLGLRNGEEFKTSEEREIKNELTDDMAKQLFIDGAKEIRELVVEDPTTGYEIVNPLVEKTVNGITYVKTTSLYKIVADKYSELFVGDAFKNIVSYTFLDIDGTLYVRNFGGQSGWSITNVRVVKVSENNEQYTYKATFNNVEGFDEGETVGSENLTSEFTIVKMEEKYKISKINYLGFDEEIKIASDGTVLDNETQNSSTNQNKVSNGTKIGTNSKEYILLYKGVEIDKKAGVQRLIEMEGPLSRLSKYETKYYKYGEREYSGKLEEVYENTYAVASVYNQWEDSFGSDVSMSFKYNARPREVENIEVPNELASKLSKNLITEVGWCADLEGDGKKEYIVWSHTNDFKYEEVNMFDSNFNHVARLAYIEVTEEEIAHPFLNTIDIIDIDNDENMEVLIHLPEYEGRGYVSILKYKNGKLLGEIDVKASIKP